MIRGEAFGTLENSHVTLSLGKLLENMLYWECKAAGSMESFLCDLGNSQSQKCYPSFIPVTEENCISCAQDTRSQYNIYLSDALDGRCWSMVTECMCYQVRWSRAYSLWLTSRSLRKYLGKDHSRVTWLLGRKVVLFMCVCAHTSLCMWFCVQIGKNQIFLGWKKTGNGWNGLFGWRSRDFILVLVLLLSNFKSWHHYLAFLVLNSIK